MASGVRAGRTSSRKWRARVARATVDAWVAEHPDALESITFVLFSADTLRTFEEADRS